MSTRLNILRFIYVCIHFTKRLPGLRKLFRCLNVHIVIANRLSLGFLNGFRFFLRFIRFIHCGPLLANFKRRWCRKLLVSTTDNVQIILRKRSAGRGALPPYISPPPRRNSADFLRFSHGIRPTIGRYIFAAQQSKSMAPGILPQTFLVAHRGNEILGPPRFRRRCRGAHRMFHRGK